jgi:membrane protease YdiL (CAAX protease family)
VVCKRAPVTLSTQGAARAQPLLGAGSAVATYLGVFAGFLLLGIAAQTKDVIAGLWITEVFAIALPAVIVLRAANVRPGPFLGLSLPPVRWLFIAVAAGLVNQPAVSLLEQAAHVLLPHGLVDTFDAKNRMLDTIFAVRGPAMIVTVALAAPLGEELFFRGFALPALARSIPAVPAVLVCGVMFAVLHLDPVGFVGLWEIGILLSVLRYASGSLWPAVICHAVNNGVAAAAFVLGLQDPTQPPPAWFLALGGAVLLAGGAAALRLLRDRPGAPAEEERLRPDDKDADAFRIERAWPLVAVWLVAVLAGGAQLVTLLRAR